VRRWFQGALVAALVSLPQTGHASDAGPESEAHLRLGVDLRRAGRNGEALAEFQKAYALVPTPRAQAQVALALQALGDWLGAERGLDEALRAADDPWIARFREALDGALATVRAHLARLTVDLNAAEGELFLNGIAAHALPTSDAIRVTAGAVDIEVRSPGYAPSRRTLEVAAGADVRVRFALEPLPAPPVNPPAATASQERQGSLDRRPAKAGRSLAGAIVLGAAGALAVGGIVAWRVREGDVANYNDNSRCRVGLLTRAAQCGGLADASNVALGLEIGAFAAGAVAAAVGAWLLSTSPRPSSGGAGVSCGPAGAAGFFCQGRF
jgi:hypothetical protein